MQPVNDDMDHLFRQAANNYPLNTQGADFDKLQQRMQTEDDAVPTRKDRRRRFAWLLLLLIALPFICEHQDDHQLADSNQLVVQQTGKGINAPTQKSSAKRTDTTIEGDSISNNLTTPNDLLAPSQQANNYPSNPTQKQTAAKQPNSTGQDLKKADDKSNTNTNALVLNSKKRTTKKAFAAGDQTTLATQKRKNRNKVANRSADPTTDKQTGDVVVIKDGQKSPNKKSTLTPPSSDANTSEKDSASKKVLGGSTQVATAPKDSATVAKATALKDSTTQDTTAQKKKLKEKEEKARLYAGIVGGPDYSVVKSSRTGGTGYNAGLVIGYRFKNHWAVETGLIWNYKKYFSAGKYVSTEKLSLQQHTDVLNLDGSCSMFEIPLTVQYHFSSKSKGHWYAAAGLSSYLMKKEEYYYLYKRYNMQYYSEKEYINSTKNWFSVLQLGGGYQLQLGKQSSLRIEPYAKLPLSGVGIAKLPLSSTGLNIGYTRSF